MGFKKPFDYYNLNHQIYSAGVELHSPYNDGYNQFEIKKDLLRLKWLIDQILQDSGTFVGEEEFIKEHEQKVMWRKLQQ